MCFDRNSLLKGLSLSALMLAMLFVTNTANAQIRAGGGIAFGTEFDGIFGIQASGVYVLNEEQGIDLAADLTLFFPDSPPGIDLSLFTINANGHYNFTSTETMMAYALGGLNIATGKVGVDFGGIGGLGSVSDSRTDVGLNLGAGAEFDVGFGYAYAEAKIVVGGADQFVVSGGVRFPLGE